MTKCEKCKKEGKKCPSCKKKAKGSSSNGKKRFGSAGKDSYAGNKRTPGASGKLYSPSGSM